MTAIIVGLTFILFGAWGMVRWFPELLTVLRGFGSLALFLGGITSLIAGISLFQNSRSNEKKEE